MNTYKYVESRDGSERGELSGATFPCRMDGCTGKRMTVKWPDGKRTYPCSKGLDHIDDKTLRII